MSKVILAQAPAPYPAFPYGPDEDYPEIGPSFELQPENRVYRAVRDMLIHLGLDAENTGKPEWNPLGSFVRPGGTILIKPNFVRDFNPLGDTDCLITHASVLRPLMDYAARALGDEGRVVVADAPLQDCSFENLDRLSRVGELMDLLRPHYPGIDFVLEDWRLTVLRRISLPFLSQKASGEQQASGADTDRYLVVDLEKQSFHTDIEDFSDLFRVTRYTPDLMREHHHPGKHEYLITKRIFEADLILNVPKMKTHIKAGLTGAMKSMVGINGHKEFLPHHIKGAYTEGGDNYMLPSWSKKLFEEFDEHVWRNMGSASPFKRSFYITALALLWRLWPRLSADKSYAGSWSGNETIWRTIIDLNHILYHYDTKSGTLMDEPQRTVLSVMDGVVAGQGEGPLTPAPNPAGLLMASFDSVSMDAVTAQLMGYNLSRIPSVHGALYDIRSRFNITRNGMPTVTDIRSGKEVEAAMDSIAPMDFALPRFWRRAACGGSRG